MPLNKPAMNHHATKVKIEKTALSLISKYGTKSVTLDDITTPLAMSKKTFYQYFESKEELLTSIVGNSLAGFKLEIQALKLKYRGLDQFLWISYHLLFWIRNTSSAVVFDLKKYHPELTEKYQLFRNKFILNNLQELIREAKLRGVVRSDVNEAIFCQMQLTLIEGVVNDQHHILSDQDQANLFEHLVLNNLKGILNNTYGVQFTIENFKLDLREVG